MKIDFFAKSTHFFDHIIPIYLGMENHGHFYIPASLEEYARSKGLDNPVVLKQRPSGEPYRFPNDEANPVVVAAYGDLDLIIRHEEVNKEVKRFKILCEHGAGYTFGATHTSYAGGTGERRKVDLFLCTNKWVYNANKKAYPSKTSVIVGCPKLDSWQKWKSKKTKKKPVIALAFHWDCRVVPETRSLFPFYESAIKKLSENFTLIGHAHPRETELMRNVFASYGIEFVETIEEVAQRADVLINDASSILYEFASLDKPVVVLNGLPYRRGVNHGLRFWEHADVGVNCEKPGDLVACVNQALEDTQDQQRKRHEAIEQVYPFLGSSVEKAVETINRYASFVPAAPANVSSIDGKSIGIVYMAFGNRAKNEVMKSMASLRKIGLKIPVCVVGNVAVPGTQFIKWDGESPFEPTRRRNFQFLAGRLKPLLYNVTPYDYTMYIDADTEFIGNIMPGFELLKENDIVVTEEMGTIGNLYNKANAGWEINIIERDFTIHFIGDKPDTKFINSGVLFFKKSSLTREVFKMWYSEWMRYEQWDEQLALHRALHCVPLTKVEHLGVEWNHPHKEQAKVIFHNYGRMTARMSVS